MSERSQDNLQRLVDELPEATRYCTDGLVNYAELVWPLGSQHIISQAKEETLTIEGVNAESTYLAEASSPHEPLFQPLPGGTPVCDPLVHLAFQSPSTDDQQPHYLQMEAVSWLLDIPSWFLVLTHNT